MIRQIAILLHHDDTAFASTNYFMKLVIAEWERMGVRVVLLRGIDRHVSADAIIPHLDMTVIPAEYREFLDLYPRAINRRLNDISKRLISRQLVVRGDAYDGPVIVKTNFNACGHSEKVANALRETVKKAIPLAFRKPLKWQIPWRFRKALDTYPVFAHPAEVPRGVWSNPALVVERFLPEREGRLYVLRNWVLLNGVGGSTKIRSFSPIVKAANSFSTEEVPVPPMLDELRRDLRVDYGKLDYVLRNGEVVLYDVNKTPTCRRGEPSPRARAMAAKMAQALFAFAGDD